MDQFAPNLAYMCDSSVNGHRLEQLAPRDPRGAFGGGVIGVNNSGIWIIYQTAGPIGTTFRTRLRIHLGMNIS